jgi:hypothetical protein
MAQPGLSPADVPVEFGPLSILPGCPAPDCAAAEAVVSDGAGIVPFSEAALEESQTSAGQLTGSTISPGGTHTLGQGSSRETSARQSLESGHFSCATSDLEVELRPVAAPLAPSYPICQV